MILRIQKINNIGLYHNYDAHADNSNRLVFQSLTLIYGSNGSGKSTLASIFRSIKENRPMKVPMSVQAQPDALKYAEIVFQTDQGRESLHKYVNEKWTTAYPQIDLFDNQFIATNNQLFDELYSTIGAGVHFNRSTRSPIKENFLSAWCLEGGKQYQDELYGLVQKQRKIILQIFRRIQKRPEQDLMNDQMEEDTVLEEVEHGFRFLNRLWPAGSGNAFLDTFHEKSDFDNNHDRIKELYDLQETEINEYLENCRQILNQYLNEFATNLQFTSIMREQLYDPTTWDYASENNIYIDPFQIKVPAVQYTAALRMYDLEQFHLSEADKRSIAISFFLANLEIQNKYSEKILIFDDPVTSFDSERKFITLATFKKLLVHDKVRQLIILSHDADLLDELQTDIDPTDIQLSRIEIQKFPEEHTSTLRAANIPLGYNHQLEFLTKYHSEPTSSLRDKRLALLYIRLVVETTLKTKYNSLIMKEKSAPKMFGQLVQLLKNKKVRFKDTDTALIIKTLGDISNKVSNYLHGTNIAIPGPVPDNDLKSITKDEIQDLISITKDLIDNRL